LSSFLKFLNFFVFFGCSSISFEEMKPYCIICNNNTIMATKAKIPIGLALETASDALQLTVEQHVLPLAAEALIVTVEAVHVAAQEPVMTTPVLEPYE
jgi:hypothetical protein